MDVIARIGIATLFNGVLTVFGLTAAHQTLVAIKNTPMGKGGAHD